MIPKLKNTSNTISERFKLQVNTSEQQKDYNALMFCVDIVNDWVEQTKQAGSALSEIKEHKYYRHWFPTFKAFCQEFWNMSYDSANNLIKYSRVARVLENKKEYKLLEQLEKSSQTVAKEIPAKATEEQVATIVNKATEGGNKKPTQTSIKEAKIEVMGTQKNFNYGVYIVKAGKYYKIGVTQHIDKRLKQIQTYNYKKVTLVKFSEFSGSSAFKLEKWLHDEYSHLRVRGEWFKLSKDDIKSIKDIL